MPDNHFAAASCNTAFRMIRLLPAVAICAATAAFAATPDNAPVMDGQTTGAPGQQAPVSRQPERPTPPPPPVNYVCEDGTRIVARFPDSVLAMLTIDDDRYELRAAIAASGVRYIGGSVEFWTHQGAARFTRAGKSTECREAPAEDKSGEPAPAK